MSCFASHSGVIVVAMLMQNKKWHKGGYNSIWLWRDSEACEDALQFDPLVSHSRSYRSSTIFYAATRAREELNRPTATKNPAKTGCEIGGVAEHRTLLPRPSPIDPPGRIDRR